MGARKIGKFHQIFFSLLDHNSFEINLINLTPALSGSLSRFGLIVVNQVLIADGFKHAETLY